MFSRELFGYFRNLELLFWNCSSKFPNGWKSIIWKAALAPQYLRTRMLSSSIIFSCEFFCYFQQVWCWFPLKWVISICVFTKLMNNSFQFKYRELQLLVLLIILEMCSSASSECAACVFFFLRKLWVWEKVRSKFVNLWEMKNLPWDCEKGTENVWHMVKPWELRGLGGGCLSRFGSTINNINKIDLGEQYNFSVVLSKNFH